MRIANLSIKQQLTMINLIMVSIALLLIAGAAIFGQIQSLKSSLQHDLSLEAQIIASNSTAALTFNDNGAARENLAALSAAPNIVYAAIYTPDGKVFAEFKRTANAVRTLSPNTPSSENRMGVTHKIILSGDEIGSVFIESDMQHIRHMVFQQSIIVLCVLIIVFLLVLILIHRLQHKITQPLLELAQLMHKVSEGKSYSLRTNISTNDEIGLLAKGFNEMLSQIQVHEAALVEHHIHLEQIVAQRTAKLTEAQRLVHLGSWEWDLTTDTFTWSDEHYRILGYNPHQIEPSFEAFMQRVHPEDREKMVEHNHNMLSAGEIYSIDYRLLMPDGSIKYAHGQAEVTCDERGEAISISGITQDITEQKKMMQILQKNEELLSFALEGSGDCVWDWHLATGEVALSKAAISMFGYAEEQLCHNISEWYPRLHPDDRKNWNDITYKLAHENTKKFWLEYRVLCNDGNYKWILTRGMAVHQPGETHNPRIIGVHTDIHQRKMAEERLSLFGHVFDASERAICLADGNWQIIYTNPAFAHMYGYQQNELQGENFSIFQADTLPEEMLSSTQQGESWVGLLKQRRKDGSEFVSANSIGCILDKQGAPRFYFNILYDYTPELERQAELSIARDKADAASRSKSDFLSNMSHEIRTPMNAIIGLSHLCLQTSLNGQQLDYLQKIHLSAKSLLGILNDILDFSKIEAGKLEIENVKFEMTDVINNLSTIVGSRAIEKGLACTFDVEPIISTQSWVGDPLRIGQILINLLGNAVKFTSKGSVGVKINVESDEMGEVMLKFVVHDTGIGLTEEQISRLFQAFSQADNSTSRKFGGTGLGLSISKRLVEMMGGDIWVESTYGKGTQFIFTIILHRSEQPSDAQLHMNNALRGRHVLVADSDPTTRHVFKNLLETFNCHVSAASDGEFALHAINQNDKTSKPYDLIILDSKMPKLNGIQLAQHIKREGTLKHIPKILLISAFNQNELICHIQSHLVDGLLSKMIFKTELFNSIVQLFGIETAVERTTTPNIDYKAAVEQLSGAHLLLVEDNLINQQVAQELLEKSGITVTLADNGQMALALIDREPFDGVLMDMQMPIMDGLTATREIRKMSQFRDTPILALTANALSSDRQKCLDAGMNDHIAKPFEYSAMLATMAKWIHPANPRKLTQTDVNIVHNQEPPLPQLPDVDVEGSIKRMGGNANSYYKLLTTFQETQTNTVTDIRTALGKGDKQGAARFAHSLKGVSGTLGMAKLQQQASDIEHQINLEHEVNARLDTLQEDLASILKHIQHALDVRSAPTAPTVMVNERPEGLQDLRILIADDNMMIQMVLEDMLSSEGAKVTCVDDGQAALDKIQDDSNWNIVLSDIEMPIMDGPTLLKHIKSLHPHMPVIGITSHDATALNYGMDAYLTKPVDKEMLIKLILQHLA